MSYFRWNFIFLILIRYASNVTLPLHIQILLIQWTSSEYWKLSTKLVHTWKTYWLLSVVPANTRLSLILMKKHGRFAKETLPAIQRFQIPHGMFLAVLNETNDSQTLTAFPWWMTQNPINMGAKRNWLATFATQSDIFSTVIQKPKWNWKICLSVLSTIAAVTAFID